MTENSYPFPIAGFWCRQSMNRCPFPLVAFPMLALTLPALAETRPLSEVTKKIEAQILRQNSRQDIECYKYILKDFQQRKVRKADVFVVFDDPGIEGIGIGISETDANYSCEGGEMRVWEAGKYSVVKQFR
ncbi:hypothetical protein RGCCGE502_29128 (plasmid) [Rhizobium grahamii CCGE 502]|uniref:Uncharacterized protein n=2 Tax=Rhizobium grahamii TaxID=1120045 RepID=S3H6Z8_9HYPH|nr:hypothetical protein RGCCGE502_29128 [Rhizobium grahamii CCGE 502]